MKKQLCLLTLLTNLGMFNTAYAHKYIIFTDETITNKAEQTAEILKTTYPFNTFQIEVEVVKVPPSDLECKSGIEINGVTIERGVTCNNLDKINKKAKELGGDQAMIVKNLPKYGGTSGIGGGVPVITSEAGPRVLLHEYLHTLGLCDEYKYPVDEAKIYCNDIKPSPNAVVIEPLPSYGSDEEAKSIHGGEIPWFGYIEVLTPITNGSALGTGTVGNVPNAVNNETTSMALSEAIGLYAGKTCDDYVPRKKVSIWHPGGSPTIMDKSEAGLGGPLEKIVEGLLLSKGFKKKLQYSTEGEQKPEVKPERAIATVGEDVSISEPPANVNNTGRGFFKSFFGWVKSIFETIGEVFSR